ncbi:MAG: response regulator [Myxococcales bacterium]|nr:MAG: response regulator [Myxococcales bacterium]
MMSSLLLVRSRSPPSSSKSGQIKNTCLWRRQVATAFTSLYYTTQAWRPLRSENLLSIILNSVHFVLQELRPDDPSRADAEQIQAATRRATALTRQLLTFSRGAEPAAVSLDINGVVRDLAPLLVGTLGEVGHLELDLAVMPCRVKLARDNLEQILVNLAVNARDAMAPGGHLVIRSRHVTDASLERAVQLTVRDDGAGMAAEVAAHAFEPFFTTKPPGQGTGLGLAIAYGIVRKAGGRITLQSSPGEGSTFTIWLPESDSPSQPSLELIDVNPPGGAGELILVVEDDDGVRAVLERLLHELGYRVVASADADQALVLLARHPVDLLLTDVILPRRAGPELARLAQALRPGLRVLFMSGYTAGELARGGLASDDGWLLHKPFNHQELASKVSAALAAPPLAVPAD